MLILLSGNTEIGNDSWLRHPSGNTERVVKHAKILVFMGYHGLPRVAWVLMCLLRDRTSLCSIAPYPRDVEAAGKLRHPTWSEATALVHKCIVSGCSFHAMSRDTAMNGSVRSQLGASVRCSRRPNSTEGAHDGQKKEPKALISSQPHESQ